MRVKRLKERRTKEKRKKRGWDKGEEGNEEKRGSRN